ncbi:MAG: radical SAM protein [Candidatus Cloacimonadaceae bacterium]
MNKVYAELTSCRICPHNCGIDRYQTTGFCQATAEVKVNLAQLHFGEEPVLSGTGGSGTIFFSHCNLRCVFCQNHTISHLGWGKIASENEIIDMMLKLQDKGAHNINLVTPTHYSVQLAAILHKAREEGLRLPIVWNSNAYEKVETLKAMEGLIDIYLPDLKYAGNEYSKLYSNAEDYPATARKAIIEMFRQAGNLFCDADNIAQKGLIVRLLVMPNGVAGVSESLKWIDDNLGNEVFISLMAQYYPAWQADKFPQINRGITDREYQEVLDTMEKLDFNNGFMQELSCSDEWTPDFKNTEGK